MSSPTPPEALRRIEECRKIRSENLDLSECGLNSIPYEISELEWLESLKLHKNSISKIKFLEKLILLKHLDISFNQVIEIESIDKLKCLESLNLQANKINKIQGLDKLINIISLDISMNIIVDIENIIQLKNIKKLNLFSNQISEIKGLESLENLSELNLQYNKISYIKNLNKLSSILKLNISGNQIQSIENLETLTTLTELDISHNLINKIKGLEKLTKILNLSLSSNKIHKISNLDKLINLKFLKLGDNNITSISGLNYLNKLNMLYLSSNNISKISDLENLSNLVNLHLDENQITEISGIQNLIKLQNLYLNFNQITEIKNLINLPRLHTLKLASNGISEIKGLDTLPNLQTLDLSSNNISSLLGFSINILDKLSEIDLSNNPIEGTTITDWKNPKAILGYLESQQDEQVTNYHLKVNIIGEGRIGKTQLLKYWKEGGIYQANEPETHGTLTIQFKIPGTEYKATIWDFGGQSYHHGFHHVFLRPNDFNLVLWRNALKKEPDYGYWLGTARSFSLTKNNEYITAPLLLVQNVWSEMDIPDQEPTYLPDWVAFPDNQKMQKYRVALGDVFVIDVKNLHRKDEIWKARHDYFEGSLYQKMIFHTRIILPTISKKWLDIKEELDQNPIHEITLKKEDFRKQYAHDFDEAALAGLLDYLEFTGNIIKFPEPSSLANYVFPNPPALSDWIYGTVLNKKLISKSQGVLKYSVLEEKVGKEEAMIFREIMDEFSLLFTEKGNENHLIIPQFLPENNSTFKRLILELIPYSFCLRFADFFHESRIFQFISEYGRYADDKTSYWRYGLVFTIDNVNALVYYNQEKRTVFVHLESKKGRIRIAHRIFNYFVFKQKTPLYKEKRLSYFAKKYKIGIDSLAKIAIRKGIEIKADPNAIVSFELNSVLAGELKWEDWHDELRRIAYGSREEYNRLENGDLDDLIEGAQLSINLEHYIDIKETLRSNAEEISIGIDVKSRQKIRLDSLTLNLLGVMNQQAKKVFISYSQLDESYKDEFKKHLVTLIHENKISTFDDRQLSLGGDWDSELKRKIDECDIMVCLISVDFLNTGYIMKTEVPRALEMGKTVVPILVRPCDWAESMLGVKNGVLKAKEISLFEEKNDRHMPVFRSSTREERDMFWLKVVKEFRTKAFENEQ